MTAESFPPNRAMVRGLTIAIGVMTVAILVLFGAVAAKLLSPSGEAAPTGGGIDFAAAPLVEIGLPPGARVVQTHVGVDRVTVEVETAEGERSVYTTPLSGFDEPVRLMFRSLE